MRCVTLFLMDLVEAQNIGDRIVDSLSNCTARAVVAGSVRRCKPTVKDIEIVAIVTDYDKLFTQLRQHGRFIKPGVPQVIDWPPKKNSKYIRMYLNEGIKLDLFVGSSDNWGALLCMRTGSGVGPDGNVHNGFIPAMFRRWKRVSGGGKMTQCMPTTPDGLQLTVPEERDYFDLLGVQWVEPQDRISSSDVRGK